MLFRSFSGEAAVREKAFQRIFMVPNTERLRAMIWDGYIKTCPPPLPEDDLHAIDQQLARIATELQPKHEKLTILSASILNDTQMMAVVNYTEFYNRCIQDAEKRPQLEQQLSEFRAKLDELLGQQRQAAESLQNVPTDFAAKLAQLKRDQERYRNYATAVATVAQYEAKLATFGTTLGAAQAEVAKAQEDLKSEIAMATQRYPEVAPEVLLNAVIENPDTNIMSVAEQYSTFVSEIGRAHV